MCLAKVASTLSRVFWEIASPKSGMFGGIRSRHEEEEPRRRRHDSRERRETRREGSHADRRREDRDRDSDRHRDGRLRREDSRERDAERRREHRERDERERRREKERDRRRSPTPVLHACHQFLLCMQTACSCCVDPANMLALCRYPGHSACICMSMCILRMPCCDQKPCACRRRSGGGTAARRRGAAGPPRSSRRRNGGRPARRPRSCRRALGMTPGRTTRTTAPTQRTPPRLRRPDTSARLHVTPTSLPITQLPHQLPTSSPTSLPFIQLFSSIPPVVSMEDCVALYGVPHACGGCTCGVQKGRAPLEIGVGVCSTSKAGNAPLNT